jgi:nucleoside-diphosphate-sugar epimerase
MRIAVLGASGVAGRAFVEAARLGSHQLGTARVNVLDLKELENGLRGYQAVVNLASAVPVSGGRGNWPMNDRLRREGVENLFTACLNQGIRLVVQQSLAMLHCVSDEREQIENDPLQGDGVFASAAEMELKIASAPLDVRSVRGGMFYGPGTGCEERFLASVARDDFRIPGDGLAWVSPVHVADYASALLCVLERGEPGHAYIASDDHPLQLFSIYGLAARQAGRTPPNLGGPVAMRSFRVSNLKLRSLGWAPCNRLFGTTRLALSFNDLRRLSVL